LHYQKSRVKGTKEKVQGSMFNVKENGKKRQGNFFPGCANIIF